MYIYQREHIWTAGSMIELLIESSWINRCSYLLFLISGNCNGGTILYSDMLRSAFSWGLFSSSRRQKASSEAPTRKTTIMQRWASSRSLSRLRLTQAGPLSSFCRSYASASTTTPELFDVVCVGGGPAGLSLVNALRRLEVYLEMANI